MNQTKKPLDPPPTPALPEKYRDRLALTVPEVAELIGLSGFAVRGLIARGELSARKLGGGAGERNHFIIAVPSLLSWLAGAK
jgi:hypothetical protein